MTEYQPELGQMMFGQPWKKHRGSELLEAALSAIRYALDTAMWNVNQETYENPFGNTGAKFECPNFSVHAYDWDDEVEQQWNFKWRDIEVSWYKYMGRGQSVNRHVTPDEIDVMLVDCLAAVHEYECNHTESPL